MKFAMGSHPRLLEKGEKVNVDTCHLGHRACFFGLGLWILLLQLGGLIDSFNPSSLSIGQMTLDGQEGKSYAELLRARYDYHLSHPAALTQETGLLSIVPQSAPDLFQADASEGKHNGITLEVKGVDVPKLINN